MDKQELDELTEIIQSSNLNFLLGAGASYPFIPLLGGIEKRLNDSPNNKKEGIYKEYLEKVMLPNKAIGQRRYFTKYPSWEWNDDRASWEKRKTKDTEASYKNTMESYEYFFKTISKILLDRKADILGKQANIFTTNIDVLMENTLEQLRFEYNDGFYGRLDPSFNIANYKKSVRQRSLHFDHISEIPVFSILKIHGSLTWKYRDQKKNLITLSRRLEHFDKKIMAKSGMAFLDDYRKILVVNPEEAKHLESVLNVYYSELLRLLSSELEKENSTLFIVGFSMADKHIREIVMRAAKSNPTLRIFIFCYSPKSYTDIKSGIKIDEHPNIKIIAPKNNQPENLLSLQNVTRVFFEKISTRKIDD